MCVDDGDLAGSCLSGHEDACTTADLMTNVRASSDVKCDEGDSGHAHASDQAVPFCASLWEAINVHTNKHLSIRSGSFEHPDPPSDAELSVCIPKRGLCKLWRVCSNLQQFIVLCLPMWLAEMESAICNVPSLRHCCQLHQK